MPSKPEFEQAIAEATDPEGFVTLEGPFQVKAEVIANALSEVAIRIALGQKSDLEVAFIGFLTRGLSMKKEQ